MPSFTSQVPNLLMVGPIVDMKIAIGTIASDMLQRNNLAVPNPIQALAMIDTGATISVVQNNLISSLNINPVGVTIITTPSLSNIQCYEYLVKLLLPNNISIETMVIGAPLPNQHIQCLIGRDVLQHSVFIYTGYNNSFTISF